jgi:hypothetical protein
MNRTNIYLSDDQLRALRALSEQRREPVAELVRTALDEWLRSQGVKVIDTTEWDRRFQALVARRRGASATAELSPETVQRDVDRAVREVRRRRPAGRR